MLSVITGQLVLGLASELLVLLLPRISTTTRATKLWNFCKSVFVTGTMA